MSLVDFLQFTGFSLGNSWLDETTFYCFRNKLVKQGKLEKLFAEVNQQLKVIEARDTQDYRTDLSADPDAT